MPFVKLNCVWRTFIVSSHESIFIHSIHQKYHELNELIENADIVRVIKSRMAWLGHVMRMDEKRTPKKVLSVETNRQENHRKTKEKMD